MLWVTEAGDPACCVYRLTCPQAASARSCDRIHLELRQESLREAHDPVVLRSADYYILFLLMYDEPRDRPAAGTAA
jgi:hypothetical protein